MKKLRTFINIRKVKSTIVATDETIKQIVRDELDKLGHDADLNHIDVSEVTNMNGLFSCDNDDLGDEYKDLNPDISRWNVSKVENMRFMFYECEKFDCDISSWNVNNVKNMSGMFIGCKSFNKDISEWDVSNVKDANYIFYNCYIKKEFRPHFVK